MKKILAGGLLLLFLVFLRYGSVLAQSPSSINETTDIKEIKARYCNDPKNPQAKSLFIETKTDEESEICIDFINTSNREAHIGINFVDATITNDDSQNKACLAEGEKTNFGQYVSDYPPTITIAANSQKRINAKLVFSGGYAGASYGCLTFHGLDEKASEADSEQSMFTIFSRVGSFIDAFVDGDFIINLTSSLINSDRLQNIGKNPNLFIYRVSQKWSDFFSKEFWTYSIQRNVKNTGNIGIKGDVTISMRSRYLFVHNKHLKDQTFLPGQVRSFTARLPWYMPRILGGPTKIKGTIDYSPIYLGQNTDQYPSQSFVLSDQSFYFYFPWLLCILIASIVVYNLIKQNDSQKLRKRLVSGRRKFKK